MENLIKISAIYSMLSPCYSDYTSIVIFFEGGEGEFEFSFEGYPGFNQTINPSNTQRVEFHLPLELCEDPITLHITGENIKISIVVIPELDPED